MIIPLLAIILLLCLVIAYDLGQVSREVSAIKSDIEEGFVTVLNGIQETQDKDK